MAVSAQKMLEKLRTLRPLLEPTTALIIKREKDLKKAKIDEFRHGRTPEGQTIGYYAWADYEAKKVTMNPLAGGTVDLILTGAFTRGLFVDNLNKGFFYFDSTDRKADKLFAEPSPYRGGSYGDTIRGLNEETWMDIQVNKIAPEVIKFIKKHLGQ